MILNRGYCPHCNSIRYDHYGYRRDAEGVLWHHRKCKACRKTYKLTVIEPPPERIDKQEPIAEPTKEEREERAQQIERRTRKRRRR